MKAHKLSISMDAALAAEVRESARRTGTAVSAWISEAAAAHLRSQALAEFLDEWQSQHGPITKEELARARRRLGYRPRDATR